MPSNQNPVSKKGQKTITQFFSKQTTNDDSPGPTKTDREARKLTKSSKLSLKRKRSNSIPPKIPLTIILSDDEDFEPIYSTRKISPKVPATDNANSALESVYKDWSSPVKENVSQNSNSSVLTEALESETILTENLKISDVLNEHQAIKSASSSPISIGFPQLVSPTRTPTPSPIKTLMKTPEQSAWISPVLTPINDKSPTKRSPLMARSISKRAQNTTLFNGSPGSSVKRKLITPENSPLKPNTSKQSFRHEKGMYLNNFLHIIEFVQSSEDDYKLFNQQDVQKIEDFQKLSQEAQKLYVRLFQRQVRWIKYTKIGYEDICDSDDIHLYLNELVYAGLLFSEDSLVDVSEALNLLDVKELTKLAKEYKVKPSGKKEEIIGNLLKIGTEQKTIVSMFKKKDTGTNQLIEKTKKIVGRCFILNRVARDVFMRFLVLYSLPNFGEEDDDGQQSQLTTLLLIKLGKLKYPPYEIMRCHSLFKSRDDLIQFVEYHQLEFDARESMAEKNWEKVLSISSIAKGKLDVLVNDVEAMTSEIALPRFLRRYTTISILYYIWSYAIEAYQRLNQYEKAVDVLQKLLSQSTHLQDSRGRWTDRLALNLEKHLKNPVGALEVIKDGLCDPEIMVGHQLALSQRAERILNSKRGKSIDQHLKDNLKLVPIKVTPKIVIQGDCVLHDSNLGRRLYVSETPSKELVSSVEEYVLSYYRSLGFSEGLHYESGVVHVLFGLLFWNCIYHTMPDVFRSPHQAVPLDLDSSHFYEARKAIFDDRLDQLARASVEDFQNDIDEIWKQHVDEVSIVNWSIFRDVDHVKSIIPCLGTKTILAICDRLLKNHRFTRSGFPDLIVWKPEDKKCSIVEVKGPNDKLSTKQILWIEYLNNHGADAKVCHVEAISTKKYWD